MAPGSAAAISVAVARQQHGAYVQLLQSLLGEVNVAQLPADDKHPDCCFVEDTAVVVGRTAIIARIGTASRQGEEAPVAAALQARGYNVQHIQPPGALDGGDVLQLPGSSRILVGLSRRTNAAALQQMQALLPQHSLHGVSVAHGLHLKSAVTALDSRTLVYADDEAGRGLQAMLQQHPALRSSSSSSGQQLWQHVLVAPHCCNLLLLGEKHVVMQGGHGPSEELLQQLTAERGLQLHKLDFGEFANADGALTCCSILLPPSE